MTALPAQLSLAFSLAPVSQIYVGEPSLRFRNRYLHSKRQTLGVQRKKTTLERTEREDLAFAASTHRRTRRKERTTMNSTTNASTNQVDIVSVGNMCIDIMLPISHYPISCGEHQRLRNGAFFEIGGSLNALVSASRLKAKTAAIAYVSDERENSHPSDCLLTQYLRSAAEAEGIDIQCLVSHPRGKVPTCAALFDPSGSHTFLASNEDFQNQELYNESLPSDIEDLVKKSKALVIDGYALHSDRELVQQCLHVAMTEQCEIWVDPQAATESLLRRKDDLFNQILNAAHGISLNLHEAQKLTGEQDLQAIVGTLSCFSNAKTIILKDGAHGSHAFAKTTIGNEMCSAAGFDIRDSYRDSIGAGDAFIGAFLAGRLVHKLGLQDCCILANAMAAATCMQHGAGVSGIGSQAQVAQILSLSPIHAESVSHILQI